MASAGSLTDPVLRQLERLGTDPGGRPLDALIEAVKTRSRTITQLAEQIAVRIDPARIVRDEKATKLVAKMGPAFGDSLRQARQALADVGPEGWQADHLLEVLKATAESAGIKLGDLMQPIRVALTGTTVSEPVNELLVVVGREESLRRLDR
jgi:glutamyl-tRNA synthetase